MNKVKKRVLVFGVLMSLAVTGVLRGSYGHAEEPLETEQEIMTEGQELIAEDEIPLADGPVTNTVAFMWCGAAMVTVLATITGWASFSKEKAVKNNKK